MHIVSRQFCADCHRLHGHLASQSISRALVRGIDFKLQTRVQNHLTLGSHTQLARATLRPHVALTLPPHVPGRRRQLHLDFALSRWRWCCHPLIFLRNLTNTSLVRGLVNVSASCSLVSIFSTDMWFSLLWRNDLNQWTRTSHHFDLGVLCPGSRLARVRHPMSSSHAVVLKVVTHIPKLRMHH